MAHSLEQWKYQQGCRSNRAGYIYAGDKRIGYAYSDKAKMFVGEADANGHLMSAAPELLKACEYALARFTHGPEAITNPNDSLPDTLRAAIAKAEGKQ